MTQSVRFIRIRRFTSLNRLYRFVLLFSVRYRIGFWLDVIIFVDEEERERRKTLVRSPPLYRQEIGGLAWISIRYSGIQCVSVSKRYWYLLRWTIAIVHVPGYIFYSERLLFSSQIIPKCLPKKSCSAVDAAVTDWVLSDFFADSQVRLRLFIITVFN